MNWDNINYLHSEFLNLSWREKQILKLLANGLQSRDISEELKLKLRTIEWYRSNLIHKFELQNAVQLILLASEFVQFDRINTENL